MTKQIPQNGRIVTVQTKYIGENFGYAPPETFYVSIDDDRMAIEAVKQLEDFTPDDDRLIEVSSTHLTKGSMTGLKMAGGAVIRA